MKTISTIDSHTGGEPTRIIIDGGPELSGGSVAEKSICFAKEFDSIRMATISEPRGSAPMVGGMLCEPADLTCAIGVIFFDDAGLLGMCGHAMIGLAVTLHHMGRIGIGSHQIETPVGIVTFELLSPNLVRLRNVTSYRTQKGVTIDVDGFGQVTGDIAWGGNWFFITEQRPCELTLANKDSLLIFTKAIRDQLDAQKLTGDGGKFIDHIELHGPSSNQGVSAKSFVLCPGGTYDRSPCGTGTSAKLACLAADGKLEPGQVWVQESIVGSIFEGTYQRFEDKVIPVITGSAYVSGESRLLLDQADPFCYGIV